MKAVEEYIRKNTNQFSNEDGFDYVPWLTPEEARMAAKIAREETIKETCEWLEENIEDYIWVEYDKDGRPINNAKGAIKQIEDLKKYLTKENEKENDYWWYLKNELRQSNVIASVTKDDEKGFIVELKLMNPIDGRTSPSISFVFENIEELDALANGIVALAKEVKE